MRLIVCLLFSSHALCEVFHVPEDCQTIQAAIDTAVDGDEIIVASGVWREQLDVSGKILFIHSESGAEDTIIDAGHQGSVVRSMSGDGIVMEGFTITGGQSIQGGGIFVSNSSPTFRSCSIEFNTANQGGGVYAVECNPFFDRCIFSFNSAFDGDGIWAKLARPKLIACIFFGDSIGWQSGEMVSITDTVGPAGACCIGSACVLTASVACWEAGGLYQGEHASCDDACDPVCDEDVTGDGVVNMTDLLRVIYAFGFCP